VKALWALVIAVYGSMWIAWEWIVITSRTRTFVSCATRGLSTNAVPYACSLSRRNSSVRMSLAFFTLHTKFVHIDAKYEVNSNLGFGNSCYLFHAIAWADYARAYFISFLLALFFQIQYLDWESPFWWNLGQSYNFEHSYSLFGNLHGISSAMSRQQTAGNPTRLQFRCPLHSNPHLL